MYPHTPTYVCFIFVVCIYDFNILSIFLWRKNENQKTEKGHSAVPLKKKRKKEKIDRKPRVFPHKYICGKQQKRQANSWYATTVHPIVSFMVVPGFFTTQSWLFFYFPFFSFFFLKTHGEGLQKQPRAKNWKINKQMYLLNANKIKLWE